MINKPFTISHAEPNEAPVLTEIALSAKRFWGYPERWMLKWEAELRVHAEDFEDRRYLAARQGEEILGFCSIRCGIEAELPDLWVRPQYMGQGIGRLLLSQALREARSRGAQVVRLDSDPHAEAFYIRMGFIRIGEKVSELEGTLRVLPRMERRFSL